MVSKGKRILVNTTIDITNKAKSMVKKRAKKNGKRALSMILKTGVMPYLTIIIPVVLVIFIVFSTMSFFTFVRFVAYAKAQTEDITSELTDVVELYSEELENTWSVESADVSDYYKNNQPVEEDEDDIPKPSSGGGSNYDSTIDEATQISGKSLMHQVYNAIVANQNSCAVPGYTVAYVLGANYTEVGGHGIVKWIPAFAIDPQSSAKPDFDLKSWGVDGVMANKSNVNFYGYATGGSYIGPFQTDYKSWNSALGKPSSSWDSDTWKKFVSGSSTTNDGNGDGVADIFNFYDALQSMCNYGKSKSGFIQGYSLTSQADSNDMLTMFIASRHVGVQGRKESPTGSWAKSEWNIWKYPYEEGVNPHVDLMRSAVNEFKNNGPHYTAYKNFLEGQSKTSSNGPESESLINQFYFANGWTLSNGYMTKPYPNGQGTMYIKGNHDQDIYYPFRVYWGGKVGEQNMKKLLSP